MYDIRTSNSSSTQRARNQTIAPMNCIKRRKTVTFTEFIGLPEEFTFYVFSIIQLNFSIFTSGRSKLFQFLFGTFRNIVNFI